MIPRSRAGTLWRAFAAAVLVIAATAATTAVAGLLQFKQLATDLSGQPALKNANVTLPPPGAPQTILAIGSDHRAGEPYRSANTDTMMLIRLNPNSSTINVLSIPRDLEVTIPGYAGNYKINAAYSLGGPNLMIKTIRRNVFPDLKVNHILDVNFSGFADLVDAIGCVYSAIDERYYNNTLYTDYSSINIQPGYQKLCGGNNAVGNGALAFVRYRHTDSDIVRNARQQDFVRWAKEQYSLGQLVANRDRLLRIFGDHVQTDNNLHTGDGLENLFNLVLNADGLTVKSIPFPAILNNCVAPAPGQTPPPCYVNANQGAEQQVYKEFMRVTKPSEAKASTTGAANRSVSPTGGHHHHSAAGVPSGLTPDPADGQTQAAALKHVPFPVYYPKLIVSGSHYCSAQTGNCDDPQQPASEYAKSYPRSYAIRDRRGHRYSAYYMTLEINPVLGEYYGVQGTTWMNPPLLDHPSATKVVNGKQLELFAAGGNLMTVAWKTPKAVYWIENTLAGTVPNKQMVQIAASLARAG
ncbi:MAG TPA: LCP family protein [Solirubrobacteraceae bacterium]|nr:LCP family protein [Solirubrobacteraceae bacterium]